MHCCSCFFVRAFDFTYLKSASIVEITGRCDESGLLNEEVFHFHLSCSSTSYKVQAIVCFLLQIKMIRQLFVENKEKRQNL